jgi:hypothetical protein
MGAENDDRSLGPRQGSVFFEKLAKGSHAEKKLELLKAVRRNIKTHLDELVQADCALVGLF